MNIDEFKANNQEELNPGLARERRLEDIATRTLINAIRVQVNLARKPLREALISAIKKGETEHICTEEREALAEDTEMWGEL